MRSIIALSIVSILFLAGCSKGPGGGGKFAMPPMPVETAQAKSEKVSDTFEAVGTLEASEAITVVSEIDASVVSLPFKEGASVGKGELIAQLDDAQLAAEVSRTEALTSQAKSRYDRVKTVVDQQAGAPQDLDDAAAALKVAQANLALAKARLTKTHIVAPFGGLIGTRQVSVGTFVRSGQALTELANIDLMRVIFSAPERFLGQVHTGAEVDITTSAAPDKKVKGKIIAIEPVLDQGTRSAKVVAVVSNPSRVLRSGMSANISAVLNSRENSLTVPNEAIFAQGTQSFVFVVKPDSTVTRTAVTLGTRMSDVVEVVKGLDPGAIVVRAGHQKIFEGAKVMPIAHTEQK